MVESLSVESRSLVGKIHNRRLRDSGRLPAVLYGHGETPVALSVGLAEFSRALRHGVKVVELKGAVNEQALVQDLQWDTYGKELLHIDLLRVSANERVSVEIPIETKGDAPGQNEGGILEHLLHIVEIEVDPAHMPEKLHVNLSKLHLGGSLTASDIYDLPEGAKLITPADEVIVHCVRPAGDADDASIAMPISEPEVIGRKTEPAEEEK